MKRFHTEDKLPHRRKDWLKRCSNAPYRRYEELVMKTKIFYVYVLAKFVEKLLM